MTRPSDYKPRAADNLASAKKCAEAIRDYWAAKGVKVDAWVEPVPVKIGPNNSRTLFTIRTNGISLVKS